MKSARLHHPGTYAVLWILLTEVLLGAVFHIQTWPAIDEGRNPYARRNWDAYIQRTAVAHAGELRILLLSNSQGRGPEYPTETIYAKQLERALNEAVHPTRVRVVNWSFGPNRVPEALVLLARARELAPHIILAVFPPAWFDEADYVQNSRPTALSMFPSDVTETAWLYRDRLPAAFQKHYLTPVTALSACFARYWPTYRYRDYPLSYLSSRYQWAEAFMPDGDRAAWFLTGKIERTRKRSQPVGSLSGRWPHPALMAMFTDAAAGLNAEKIFVLQPHFYRMTAGAEVLVPMRDHLERNGWTVWDMTASVPWPLFLESNIHFSDEGHRLFAVQLASRLKPQLMALAGVPRVQRAQRSSAP